jgi:hypothetical protein
MRGESGNEREPKPPPLVSAVEGLPGGLLRPGISPQRGACSEPAQTYSAGGVGFLGLRRLSPPNMKISEFSTSRSAIAVAMVVLKRMLPQSENAVLVVMIVERLWLWRVEIT